MTTKHTPAPWHYYTKGSDIYVEDAKENGIANIRRNFELPFNEKMANAKLIAAAPELLEILQLMAEKDFEFLEYERILARQAIAKATGE